MKGEFDLIETYFAPLASEESGSLNLKDDAAVLPVNQGMSIVVTTDCLVSGVHFLPNDPPETIAIKLLAVNFSDLASMGATPRHYTIAAALPRSIDEEWVSRFSQGIKDGQSRFGAVLVGGDTVSTDGPLTLTLTALGEVPIGRALKRSEAKPGEMLYVSGAIGDAGIGLRVLRDEFPNLSDDARRFAVERYQTPIPRIELGHALRGLASAAVDVSDGLVADLGHLCEASCVGADVDSAKVPLSSLSRELLGSGHVSLQELYSSGDDYELIFSVSSSKISELEDVMSAFSVPITKIGTVTKAVDILIRDGKGLLHFDKTGYRHF